MLGRRKKPRKRSTWRREAALPVRAPEPLPEVKEALEREVACVRQWDAWLREQRCVIGEFSADPCDDKPVQLMHRDEGKGERMKTADEHKIPGCPRHHRLLGNSIRSARPETVIDYVLLLQRLVHRLASQVVRQRYLVRGSWTPMERDLPWR